jgi:branched-chain amino acid transport system substrate-binding protein
MRNRLLVPVLAIFVLGLVAALGSAVAAGADGASAVALKACGPVQYGGGGTPDALVVSDLPLQGDSHERSTQMNEAIRLVIEGAGWHAGATTIGFQACDDSSAKTGLWTAAICKANARAYAADESVLAVIGTYNSGCAELEIPILGAAPGGGVAMVSPGNTAICLTETSASCTGGTPGSLYPKVHNYARVVPNDAYQGAGLAAFAKGEGIGSAYVLYAGGDPTSLGQAKTFTGAAKQLGIKIAGTAAWNEKAKSYTRLMEKVAAAEPDAVLLAGLTEQNGAKLIEDKVAVLGPNGGAVKLLAPDGFAQQSTIELAGAASKGMFASVPGLVPQALKGPGKQLVGKLKKEVRGAVKLLAPDGFAQQSTIELAGAASKGMFASVPGLVPQALKGPGKQLVGKLKKEVRGAVELYAPYAGQAAALVLGAVEVAGTSRAATIAGVAGAKVTNGITGSFQILASGDPSVGPITVSEAGKTFVPKRVIRPSAKLVAAARG